MKKHVIYLIISTTTLWYGCKKEELIKSSQIPNNNSTERFIEEVFTESRTPANAILAIEYELNMVDADTNMLKGATKYGETYLDSLVIDDLGIENGEISATNQSDLYDNISNAVNEIKLNHFNNSSEGDVVLVDLNYDESSGEVFIYVVSGIKIEDNCACSFTTTATIDLSNPSSFNCNDFSDKLDQFYQVCNVTENIGYYYDFKYYPYYNNYINAGSLSYSLTPSQQSTAISYLNSQLYSFINYEHPNEFVLNRDHISDYIFSPTLRLSFSVAKKYNGIVPF